MIISLIILAAILGGGAIVYLLDKVVLSKKAEPLEEQDQNPSQEDECCGQHAVCERDSLLAAVSSDIIYYEDEELDAFRGRSAESYTPEECEAFRDVMLTLLPDDVAGWGRSIQLRGIELPESIRDEYLMMAAELRSNH